MAIRCIFLARRLSCAHLTAMHGRLLAADHGPLLREFSEAPFVSISDDQRGPVPEANWRATIHHGLPSDAFALNKSTGYLLFLRRMMPQKRPDLAIEIARRSTLTLARGDGAQRAPMGRYAGLPV